MKRLLPVLVCFVAGAAVAQNTPATPSAELSAPESQNVTVSGDGRCVTVRPRDTVHYTLTIEDVGVARGVYGDLRLRLGRSHGELLHGGLPVPDFRSLGGGGLGTRDKDDPKLYHFAFKVPEEIFGGTYHGVEVMARADGSEQPQPQRFEMVSQRRLPRIEVTRHTREEVRSYCLNVMSNFGVVITAHPAVTNFEPGPVNPPPAPPPPPRPLPPSQF